MGEPASSPRQLRAEIEAAMAAIRSSPEAIPPRMALFQLACVVGEWDRARKQLDALAALDPECALLAQVYGRVIEAEETRRRVFAGTERPVALGEPPAWLAMMGHALQLDGKGEGARARELRERARQEASPRPGRIGDEDFAWLMDADPRLGPTLEVVVEGQYRWLPFDLLLELRAEPPRALRDLVWQPASLRIVGGGEVGVFVPVRYPGSESDDEAAVRLARETRWIEREGEQWGLGQRILATDVGDHPFLDVRLLRFREEAAARDA